MSFTTFSPSSLLLTLTFCNYGLSPQIQKGKKRDSRRRPISSLLAFFTCIKFNGPGFICDKNVDLSRPLAALFCPSEILRVEASVCALITPSPFSHLQAVSVVDSRWDPVLLPYRLVCVGFFLLLLFSRMGPFCHLIEAHGLGPGNGTLGNKTSSG